MDYVVCKYRIEYKKERHDGYGVGSYTRINGNMYFRHNMEDMLLFIKKYKKTINNFVCSDRFKKMCKPHMHNDGINPAHNKNYGMLNNIEYFAN